MLKPKNFNLRQQMTLSTYELQYKRDSYLQNVQLHHHDFYEIYFLVSGDVTYTIENKLYHVAPGDVLLISPNELHQVHIVPEMDAYERYVLWVKPEMVEKLSTEKTDLFRNLGLTASDHENQLRLDPGDQRQIHMLMQMLYEETQIESYGAELMQNSLLTQLLVTVNRLADQKKNYEADSIQTNKYVSQAIEYINSHYAEPISLEQLANLFYVSKSHLSHEFQHLVGTSVYRYIQKKRLLIACQLLAQGKKPNAVYVSCGFNDYTGFYRAFKTEYGLSPREYSRLIRKDS